MFDKNIDTIDQEHSGDLYCDLPYRFSMDTVVNKNGQRSIAIKLHCITYIRCKGSL